MGTITINGETYTGNNITVRNNQVFIDGKEATPGDKPPIINITVQGDIESINTGSVNEFTVHGNIGTVTTGSGDVEVEGNINGSCKTGSGNITAKLINGDCKTGSGNIKYVKP